MWALKASSDPSQEQFFCHVASQRQLAIWRRENLPYLFNPKRPLSINLISRTFQNICRKANVVDRNGQPPKLKFLRRYVFGSMANDSIVSEVEAQSFGRHKSVDTQKNYKKCSAVSETNANICLARRDNIIRPPVIHPFLAQAPSVQPTTFSTAASAPINPPLVNMPSLVQQPAHDPRIVYQQMQTQLYAQGQSVAQMPQSVAQMPQQSKFFPLLFAFDCRHLRSHCRSLRFLIR